jgi:hypothetical protein
VFENRVLSRIFGPKRDEVTGGWRKLYNGCSCNLYYSQSIISMTKEDEMGTMCSTNGEKMKAYRFLIGKPEGNRPL